MKNKSLSEIPPYSWVDNYGRTTQAWEIEDVKTAIKKFLEKLKDRCKERLKLQQTDDAKIDEGSNKLLYQLYLKPINEEIDKTAEEVFGRIK